MLKTVILSPRGEESHFKVRFFEHNSAKLNLLSERQKSPEMTEPAQGGKACSE